jgi:hypothetical protein
MKLMEISWLVKKSDVYMEFEWDSQKEKAVESKPLIDFKGTLFV